MVIGINHLLDCLDGPNSTDKHSIEEWIPLLEEKDPTSKTLCHLLIDVDTSLERLYGGFYSDWLAGGEWTHLSSYIQSLLKSCEDLSLCLIFCFDGTLYRYGQSQWYEEQTQQRKKVNQIFKHFKQNKSGLPRRQLWLAPPAFQLCLRMILRELNSPHLLMFQTWGYGAGQHQDQVKTYANRYRQSLLGIVSSDMEFFFPKRSNDQMTFLRYFSSKHLKLSMKGKLTLMEIQLKQLQDKVALDHPQFALLCALLGNHLLSDSDLFHFHLDLLRDQDHSTPSSSKRVSLKSNGTLSPPIIDSSLSDITNDLCSPGVNALDTSEDPPPTSSVTSPVPFSTQSRTNGTYHSSAHNPTVDQLIPRLVDFIRKQNLDIPIDFDALTRQIFKHVTDDEIRQSKKQSLIDAYEYYFKAIQENQSAGDSLATISSSQISVHKSDESMLLEECSSVNQEILRTAFNLHQQGLIMPWVLQCLYKREITFPVTIEPEMCNTMPNICEFYRPIRQYLYSLLFNQPVTVREQAYNSEHGSYVTEITCEPFTSSEWTIEQLWFGTNPDEDGPLRLKVFLQALQYCHLPRFYTVSHEYLLLVSTLRYIYMGLSQHSTTNILIQMHELMTFVSQAVLIMESQAKSQTNNQTPNLLHEYEHIQIVQYETRPVQLAHLFMRGLETILFANDVCGAPIHSKYACPSHFFNGKLFHQKYLQAQYYQQNPDLFMVLCDGNTHYAETAAQLLDIILDRSSNGQIVNTPLQQPSYPMGPPHQARLGKNVSRGARPQTSLANSIRPAMRTLNKQNAQINPQQHQTPVTNHRQQTLAPPPPVKQPGPIRNGINKNHTFATPFIAKQTTKQNVRTPTPMQYHKPVLQNPPMTNDHWNATLSPQSAPVGSMQPPQPYPTINPMPTMIYPVPATGQAISSSYINSMEDQFAHLHIHPNSMMSSTPIPYAAIPSMMHSPYPPGSYQTLPPPALPLGASFTPYGIPPGTSYYQPSPQSAGLYPHPLATPYHSAHPSMMPGLPPHAPLPPQRTVNFTAVLPQGANQRFSPNSMATPELHLQVVQPRIHDQATPIALQRQMTRIPSNDYAQYDPHRSASNNGPIPMMAAVPVQSRPYPSMIREHPPRAAHGPC